ncbi:MAG TPA: PEPxxWA-CTERM sorting domain-containing protein, partial [Phenylobacterium sp.]
GTAVSTGVTDNAGSLIFAITSAFGPFTALTGQSYFFAASDLAGHGYSFGVESSSGGVGAQTGGGLGNYYALRQGEAFSLSGASAANAGVPEPASWALMLVGFGGVGALARGRRRTPSVA